MEEAKDILIPSNYDIVFVADLFTEQYVGGAELTTQALYESVPEGMQVYRINARNVTLKTLESGMNKFWIFGNATSLNFELLPSVIANLNYSILEYDYKFCKYRSMEKHKASENKDCDCHTQQHGKILSAFFHGAKSVFYMSEGQMKIYHDRFPFLSNPSEGSNQIVLSSVFDDKFFAAIKQLRSTKKTKNKWIVLGSTSWIKGTQDAIAWCQENGKNYEVVQGLEYVEVLSKLAESEGFVFLPRGSDTCPRIVLEAQLLGCELHLNDNVQHHSEFPFTGGTLEDVEIYLYGRRETFWSQTKIDMNWNPKISGYTTTFNCESQDYPYIQSIKSLLGFCDEVVVMDGGSTDGTFEELTTMATQIEKLKVYQHVIDWNATRSGVEDGAQKARARNKCTLPFCWQQDSDEIVHENHYEQIIKLCRQFPKFVDLVCLPVIEYWGGEEKVRMDINPWKWRLSRNKPNITHGIPKHLRKTDEDGNLYASLGTDGCDYIDAETHEYIAHASFYTPEVHNLRLEALNGNEQAKKNYSVWFNEVVDAIPGVFHYSWFNLERKIKTYKNFWSRHWQSLYDIKQEDTAKNNMFFDKPWSAVTDSDIKSLAKDLKEKMGGWIFHSKINFSKPTPHLQIKLNQPKVMKEQ
jgi:glycosyltransferase involved in cell wall biosynthesis